MLSGKKKSCQRLDLNVIIPDYLTCTNEIERNVYETLSEQTERNLPVNGNNSCQTVMVDKDVMYQNLTVYLTRPNGHELNSYHSIQEVTEMDSIPRELPKINDEFSNVNTISSVYLTQPYNNESIPIEQTTVKTKAM